MKFVDCLTDSSRQTWLVLCRDTGVKIDKKKEPGTSVEARLEPLEEIDKIMRLKPRRRE